MTIEWSQFTPLTASLGGLLIGLAAITLMAFNGRIAGISGIIGNLLPWSKSESLWKLAFIIGILLAPFIWQIFAALPVSVVNTSTPSLIVAGLLVGFGTRLASGCTSGHGVCGLSRLSVRSLVATLSFMLAGFATVFIIRHVIGA